METIVFILLFSGVVAFTLWNGWHRAGQIHQLVKQGLPVTGVITRKRKRPGKAQRYIEYAWTLSGQTHKGKSHLGLEEFSRWNEGDPIALRYLPGKAGVAAPEFVVEQARKAAAEIEARNTRR